MAEFTYNKLRRRWYRSDGSEVKPGNRVLGKNGIYYLYNTDGSISRVGSVSGGLDKSYIDWKKKHGQAVNITLENNAMRSGLIKDRTGKWRLNSIDNSTRTKQVNGKSYFASKDGLWRNFDTGLKISEQNKLDLVAKNKALNKLTYNNSDESWGEKIKNHGIVEGILDKGLDELGVAKNSGWRTAASLASTGLYTIPIVGTALSLGDAGLAAARGDWADAALSVGMGLIPVTRGLKSLRTVNKALGSNKVGFFNKGFSKLTGKPALTRSLRMVGDLNRVNPAISDVYSATQYLRNSKNPLSKIHLIGKHNISVGNKTARALELANNGWVNAGLMGASVGLGLYKDYKNENIYANQLEDILSKQLELDIDSGIIYGRMSNSDFNSNVGKDYSVDKDTYNIIRNAYALGLN